jgi:hypothetical protein
MKNCKGCLLYDERNFSHCGINSIYNGENCPCMMCIIKMVCRKICPDLRLYKDKYYKGRYDGKYYK